ncbi:MAG: sensor histidine kinase KdpD [Hyphomicrobiaceae bacterium]|nr:MAG: sensor histidine kinase KdpD [Hyphomicrobiaceae bacterium]
MADEPSAPEHRPLPDALLAEARREERGRTGHLTVFVGAAPGVGKTYAMLEAARARLKEGVDVVVGVIETHGRKETEALLEGLEVLLRRPVVHAGALMSEFDLDRALKRRPALVLVDELAHSNLPGSRHPKRYQDAEDLLDAGIDVYTTVNIQHIESLNDVVAQITRVRVREIVPDAVLDRADAIKLVDLTPDELIQRLKQGKVYVPKQAERALKHYFSPANLTALRELALRRTAERVDDQLLEQMQAHAIPGPWAAGERIVVCVSEDRRAAGLVRHAKRLADRLHAPWTALCVETSRSLQLSEDERDRIADVLRLAERLGGEAVTVPAKTRRIADDVISFAQKNNVTHIIIGKSTRSRWFEILHGSVVHDLVRRAGNISVHVIAGEEISNEPIAKKAVGAATGPEPLDIRPHVYALLSVAAAVGFGALLWPWIGLANTGLVFLTAIVGVAVRLGLWPSLLASAVSALCYNFFFTEPYYTFAISDPSNVLAVVFFAIVAIVVSNVAGRARLQHVATMERARTTESLYAFSRKLAGAGTLDDVLWATAHQIAAMLKVHVVLLLPDGGFLGVKAGYPPEDRLDEADVAAAKWAWEQNRPAGRDSDALPGAKWLFLPLRTGRGTIGIVGITREEPSPLLRVEQRRLLDALSDQGALAIERVHLVEDIERVRRAAETDRLRSALLTSISHDLKTPLAAVLGAAGALRSLSTSFDDAARADLLSTIVDESERLNRFIANLLDMTKLESGAVVPNAALYDIGEIIGSALERASKVLARHRLEVDIRPDLPMVMVDAVLLEQVLFNLLDNAAKYAPLDTTIRIQSWREKDSIRLQVLDEGNGIPPADLERIFDKFYRAQKGDQVRAGTGLGLAISRGFVEAMQGAISAANRSDRPGAVFTITLPIPEAAEPREVAA